eukprot:11039933-Alexandrium_andersonii.AAC.1
MHNPATISAGGEHLQDVLISGDRPEVVQALSPSTHGALAIRACEGQVGKLLEEHFEAARAPHRQVGEPHFGVAVHE